MNLASSTIDEKVMSVVIIYPVGPVGRTFSQDEIARAESTLVREGFQVRNSTLAGVEVEHKGLVSKKRLRRLGLTCCNQAGISQD